MSSTPSEEHPLEEPSSTAATEATSTADAPAKPQSGELVELQARLHSFLKEGESLKPWSDSKAVALSYFRPFNSTEKKTHLCVLCTLAEQARVCLESTSNAKKHMERYHPAVHSTGLLFQRPRDSYEASVDVLLRRAAAGSRALGVEARTRRKHLAEKARAATAEQTDLVRHCVAKLCATRLLPYSAVEWDELRELVEVCCLLPSVKVRPTMKSDRYNFL